jgi:hypothetical protein
MSNPQYTQMFIQDWDRWQESVQPSLELLQIRMRRAGIEITTEEAFAYMLWCHSNTLDGILGNLSAEAATSVRQMMQVVAEGCQQNFKQTKLGVLMPPLMSQPHWATHAEAVQALHPIKPVSTETHQPGFGHRGYL